MANIELVIKIPDEAYKTCLKLKGELDEDNSILGICLINSVANGTPIPKGHGELIDKQSLKLSFFTLSRFYKTWNLGKNKIMGEIENAPAIIGASKESEE